MEATQKEIIKVALARLKFNVEFAEKLLDDKELSEDEVTGTFAVVMMDTLRGADALYDLARMPLDGLLLKTGSIEDYIKLIDGCNQKFKEAVNNSHQGLAQNLSHLMTDPPEDN